MQFQRMFSGFEEKKPDGGYSLISVVQFSMAWWLYLEGHITIAALRVWLAAFELLAKRCEAEKGMPLRFSLDELAKLTGIRDVRLRSCLRSLEELGLLIFSETHIILARSPKDLSVSDLSSFYRFLEAIPNNRRLLPVPRRMLRLMAGGGVPSLIATVFAFIIRGIYSHRVDGQTVLRNGGFVKLSWIAETFGFSDRQIQRAAHHLVDLGWLVPEETGQRTMNARGGGFHINFRWVLSDLPALDEGETEPEAPREMSPQPAEIEPEMSPPYKQETLPAEESKNQKPATGGSGVCNHPSEKKEPDPEPTLRNVVPADLKDTARLMELHRQAVDAGLVTDSENDRLRFVGAAEHARSVGTQNPPGLFVRIVRSKLWHFITQDDENSARLRLNEYFFGPPRAREGGSGLGSLFQPTPAAQARPSLSDDARLVIAARAAATQTGYRGNPFYLLRQRDSAWTIDRWDRAVAELEGQRRTA